MNSITQERFHEWFVGFAEGDGSWNIESGKRCIFIITQKDPRILYKIKKRLNCGSIGGPYRNKGQKTEHYRFRIGDLEGTRMLIKIFNSKLVLKKTKVRFADYVNQYNNQE